MIRVLIIHQHDPGISHVGGTGTFISTFFKYAPRDFDVKLIGVSTDPERRPVGKWQSFEIDGRSHPFLPIVAAHPTYHGPFPLSLRFVWALNRYRPLIDFRDAILEFHRIESEIALRDKKNPKTVFFHTHPKDLYNPKTEVFWKRFPWLYFMLESRLIKNMSQLYSVREDIIPWYRERYPDLHQPFFFLPTWVDEDVFTSLPEPDRKRLKKEFSQTYGLDPEDKFLLFVGRFELQKDPFLLLESFRCLLRQVPRARLIMVGGGSMESSLKQFISEHNLDRVHFTGPKPQSEIAKWMNAADCLCLTSAYEGMPRVVVEAFRCGLPAVSMEQGEEKRLVNHSAVGRLVKERTPEAVSSAMAEVLNQAPDREACQRQVEPFSAKTILGQLFDRYRKLADEKLR